MDITTYIQKLLYVNDCVIIPGLGGFVADYSPAQIHPTSHTFYPPSKSILFNSKLFNDDGILMHCIAQQEKITYAEAKGEINYFVQGLILDLEEGKEIYLDKIGSIRKIPEGNFLFNPDKSVNYLEESFGLPTFISPPISRKPSRRKHEKIFVDRRLSPARERKSRKIYWAYLALIPVVLIVGWFILIKGFDQKTAQQSGVITMRESGMEAPASPNKPDAELNKNVKPLKDLDLKDTSRPSGDELKISSEGFTEENEYRTNIPKYYIIGGAFQYKQNADNLVASLRQNGYNAELAGTNPRGLHLVSYFNSEDKSKALTNLTIIRKENNPSAWLLKK